MRGRASRCEGPGGCVAGRVQRSLGAGQAYAKPSGLCHVNSLAQQLAAVGFDHVARQPTGLAVGQACSGRGERRRVVGGRGTEGTVALNWAGESSGGGPTLPSSASSSARHGMHAQCSTTQGACTEAQEGGGRHCPQTHTGPGVRRALPTHPTLQFAELPTHPPTLELAAVLLAGALGSGAAGHNFLDVVALQVEVWRADMAG